MQIYPHTYCSGFTAFISTDLVPMLYHAAIRSPIFWVDDFYLFMFLPARIPSVIHENIGTYLTLKFFEGLQCYQKNGTKCQYVVMPAKDKEIIKMWVVITKDRKQSIYGNYYMNLPPKTVD